MNPLDDTTLTLKKSGKRPKRKVTAEWDDYEIAKLILSVESRECLWNAQSKKYRNKNQRNAAWKEICDIFEGKYSVNDISAKWSNLRIQFRSYANKLNKFKKTKSGQGSNSYKINWRFFKPLLFIQQSTQSTELELSSSSEASIALEEEPWPADMETSGVTSRNQKIEEINFADAPKTIAIDALKKMNEEKNDEFQIFGDFIAIELRKIPKRSDAYKIQRKMQRLLLDFMDDLDDNEFF